MTEIQKVLQSLPQKIDDAEKFLMNQPQAPAPVIHRYGPGTYIREVMLPAGAIAIGHHQNFEHTNIFLKGRVTMLNDDGTTTEMTAPMIFVSKPGRKVGYIHEDVVWLNVYATNETNVEKLEKHFLTKSDGWLDQASSIEQIKQLSNSVDKNDFSQMLIDLGVSADLVRSQSENKDDLVDLPFGGYKIKLAKSNIEGQGLFATADIKENEIIAPARIDWKRTIAGRFTNHSKNPNAKMIRTSKDSDIDLISIRKITGCHGGLDGEEITIDYREAYRLNNEIGFRG